MVTYTNFYAYHFMKIKNEIRDHLLECRKFQCFVDRQDLPGQSTDIICTCGKVWKIPYAYYEGEDMSTFLKSAEMFSHAIRDKAVINTTPIEEIIDPGLGICLEGF